MSDSNNDEDDEGGERCWLWQRVDGVEAPSGTERGSWPEHPLPIDTTINCKHG
jgi:hypothetical protein